MAAFLHLAFAQPTNLSFQHLNQSNGLSQGMCSFTARDREGFAWVGTVDGLNRFDGQHVKTYHPAPGKPHSLLGNIVTSRCFEDGRGDLWFTTYNAVHRYNRASDDFDVFQLKNRAGQVIPEDYYAFHLDSAGQFWCRTGLGESGVLHLFDTRRLRDSILCPLDGLRAAVLTDARGAVNKVISSMFDGKPGLAVLDLTRNFETKTYLSGHDDGPALNTNEVFAESDTAVWVGLWAGMARLNLLTGGLRTYPDFEGKTLPSVWGMQPYGNWLFASSTAGGLLVFDKKRDVFVHQYQFEQGNPRGLQSNDGHDLYLDSEENLWLSQWGDGLTFVNLRKNKFHFLPKAKGEFFSTICALPDGNILCSTRSGAFIYSPAGQLLDVLDNRIPGQVFPAMLSPALLDPNLYFFKNQLITLDRGRKKLRVVQEIKTGNLRQMLALPGGEHLAVFTNGLFKAERAGGGKLQFSPFPMTTPYPFKGAGSAFCTRRGRVLVSENSESLLVFERTAQGLSLLKSFPGMGSCKAFWESPETGAVWIAGTAGLAKLDADLSLHLFNEAEDGLPNETFYAVLPDKKGRFWLPSNRQLWCYDPATHQKKGYQSSDGLAIREFNTGAWHQFPDGEIWVGGIGGLVAFHPDSIRPVPFAPRVQFTRILINDLPRDTGSPAETLDLLDLPFSQNTLSFEFVALEFSDPAANQFQYRLLGYDENWVKNVTSGFARYANLPPGTYTFEVLAANSDGVWGREAKRLSIHIRPPFWQTWWFYLLVFGAIGGLVYGWFWYRLQQALRIERMRVQISSDLHDDVGTLLSGLAMQSEVLELTAPATDKPKLRRISDISREAMAHMRDTVWAIDARLDRLENLLDRMREHAEETLVPRHFRFDFQVENLPLRQTLAANVRQAIYLIYKEAVTNAAKHSNGDAVQISLKKVGNGVEMRVFDNGTASEKAYKTTGAGLGNMAMRAEKVGGAVAIERSGEGFCVVLRLPSLG